MAPALVFRSTPAGALLVRFPHSGMRLERMERRLLPPCCWERSSGDCFDLADTTAQAEALERGTTVKPHRQTWRPKAKTNGRSRRWAPPGVCLSQQPLDAETVAAPIPIAGGTFLCLVACCRNRSGFLESTRFQC